MNEAATNGMPAISSLARVLGVKPAPVMLEGIVINVSLEARRLDDSQVFPPVISTLKISSPDNSDLRESNINQTSAFLNGLTRSFMSQVSAALPVGAQVVVDDAKILTMPKSNRDDLH